MNGDKKESGLSARALSDFRRIYEEEFGELLSDSELNEKATGLLKIFGSVSRAPGQSDKPIRVLVTEREFKALKYLHTVMCHEGKSLSLRDVCAAIGFSSSRSGKVLVDGLIRRGLAYRDVQGRLLLSQGFRPFCRSGAFTSMISIIHPK